MASRKRRFVSILAALALLLGLLPAASASAEDGGSYSSSIQWSFSGDTLKLTGTGPMLYGTTTPWDKYKSDIRRVEVGYGITTLCNNAFAGCTRLTDVELPGSLQNIGDNAFADCTALTSIEFPRSLELIGNGAFRSSGLTSVEFPGSVDFLYSEAFAYCDGLTEVELPDTIHTINGQVFYGCANLTTVDLPAISVMGEYVFGECPKLKTVYWPEYMSASYNYFNGCNPLTVYYEGSREEWEGIAQWKGQLVPAGSTIYYGSGGSGTETPTPAPTVTPKPTATPAPTPAPTPTPTPTPAQTGQAMEDGKYPIRFRSEVVYGSLTYEFYYSEDFFSHPATEYDHDLAKMTLGMVMAGFSTSSSDREYNTDGDMGREDHIRQAYETLGFDGAAFYNYDVALDCTDHKVAFSFARKTLEENGQTYTVIPVIIRGGGYGAEWASNFYVNDDSAHAGFRRAAEEVYDALEEYVEEAEAGGLSLGTVKLWIGGYSRGAAVANLLAAKVCNDFSRVDSDHVYAYTFATPQAVTGMEEGGVSWDYNNNYGNSLIFKEGYDPSNIHNIIYSGDVVPRVPLNDWGYQRNGNDLFLPVTRISVEVGGLNAAYKEITRQNINFKELANSGRIQDLENSLASIAKDAAYYEKHYQEAIMDIFQYLYMVPNRSVVSESKDNLDEIARQIASLDHISASPEEVASKWDAAQAISDVVYLAKEIQVPVPLILIGMIHGLGPDVLGILFQYAVGVFPDNLLSDDFSEVAMGHHPEVYLALMEYYDYQDENDYSMRPVTNTETSNWLDTLMPDVARGSYYNSAVTWAVSNGVTTGTTATTFSPDRACTRAEVVTFLWRAYGSPMVEDDGVPFQDVSSDAFYYDAVRWAVESGITSGSSATTFSPNAVCTRAQVVTFLWRAHADQPKLSGSTVFRDVKSSDYYWYPVRWAASNDVTTGTSSTTFSPDLPCTRAQVVTFLYRDQRL